MLRVYSDKTLQLKISLAARQTAEKKVGLKNNVKKTLIYLESLVKNENDK